LKVETAILRLYILYSIFFMLSINTKTHYGVYYIHTICKKLMLKLESAYGTKGNLEMLITKTVTHKALY
jgi:hypothetical protein